MQHLGRVLVGLTFGIVLAFSALAQGELAKELDRWDALAVRAEATIDSGNGTDQALEGLRERIAEYRSKFEQAQGLNAGRIAILRDQVAALGAAPEGDGALPEEPQIQAKRQELNGQLAALQAPAQQAQAAFRRADGLIGQIDKILRDRQNRRLLEVAPSPLNPIHWRPAVDDLKKGAMALWTENDTGQNGNDMQVLRASAPVVLLLGLLGVVLILRGRRWSHLIVGRLRRLGAPGFGIWRFVVSLLRVILPFAGIVLLVVAAISTGQFGPKATGLLTGLAVLSAIMLGFRWVSERVFSRDDDEALLLLSPAQRAQMRFHVTILTLTIVLGEVIELVLEADTPLAGSKPVLLFPVMLISAFSLYRIGRLLRGYLNPQPPQDGEEPSRASTLCRIVQWLGTGAIAVAIVTPLLMAAGYFKAADALLTPYIVTLVLFWLLLTLQRFVADIFGAVTGQGMQARDSLMAVLFGLVLTALAIPLFALIWGARLTDLTELWAAFGRGFSIGDSRISPTDFLTFALIFVIGYILTRLVQSSLRNNVLPKTGIDIGGQNAIVSGLGYVGIFLAALMAITGAGIDLSSLAIVAGALSVGIGFGLQNIVSNFVSGIILLIERPISEGDWIEVSSGQMGYVRDISVRSTRIETFDRTDVIVPNSDLVSGTVTNYTRGNTVGRVIVPIGVAYGTDTKRVDAILHEIAQAQPMVLMSPPPSVIFMNFGADALEFEVRCFLRDVNWLLVVKNDINHAIAARFAEEGIEIPFAQRDVWLRNPEVLQPAPATAPAMAKQDPDA